MARDKKKEEDRFVKVPLKDAAIVRVLMDPLLFLAEEELPAPVSFAGPSGGKKVQVTFHIKDADGRFQSFTRHARVINGKLYLRGFRQIHDRVDGKPVVLEADADIPRDSARIKALFEVPGAEVKIPPAFLQNLEGRIPIPLPLPKLEPKTEQVPA